MALWVLWAARWDRQDRGRVGDLRAGGSDSGQGFSHQVMLTWLVPPIAIVVVVRWVVDGANEHHAKQEQQDHEYDHAACEP